MHPQELLLIKNARQNLTGGSMHQNDETSSQEAPSSQ